MRGVVWNFRLTLAVCSFRFFPVLRSKILEEKPDDTVAFAATYFTTPGLEEVIKEEMGNPTMFGS